MTLIKRPPLDIYEKHPLEVLPFQWNWRERIDGHPILSGQAISASTWTVTVGGVALTMATPSFTNDSTIAYATGGAAGIEYQVENKITVGSAQLVHEFKISVVDV